MDRQTMVSAETFTYPDPACIGACGRTRELEDYSVESAASTFPNELIELFLRHNANPIWQLHALGVDRTGAWPFFVCLRRQPGSGCSAPYAVKKLCSPDCGFDY